MQNHPLSLLCAAAFPVHWGRWSLAILLVLILSVGTFFLIAPRKSWPVLLRMLRTQFPKVQQLSTRQLSRWLEDKKRQAPLLLDIREPEEYAVSHLKDANNVPPNTPIDKVIALIIKHKNRAVVLYCSVGYRSSKMATALIEAGVKEVYNLEGSIFKWANEGHEIVREGKSTKEVHPFDTFWGQLLKKQHHPTRLPQTSQASTKKP